MADEELSSQARPPLLERLALHRPELRAWALYDWANSALFTVVVTAVFPIFYRQVAAAGLDDAEKTRSFALATTWSLAVAALISPLLGAFADFARMKKKLFAVFLALGVLATAGMYWIHEGDTTLALWLFGLANLGAAGSFVFYDALLPSVAREKELDQLSSSAYAIGYLGGGLCLALCLALLTWPASFGLAQDGSTDAASLPARVGFVIVAVWWLVFSVPLFRRVPEPALALESDEAHGMNPLRVALTRVVETFRELRRYRDAFVLMLAFLVYNDGIGTIIRMATIFGDEQKIPRGTMIAVILMVQIVGIPFAILFGRLAARIGAKRAILVAIGAYLLITLLAWRMSSVGEFVALGALVAMVQGGAQALSRSLFASLVPKHKSGEFFGLFSTLEKFAGVIGPFLFGISPSRGMFIAALMGFFVVGGALLWLVDVQRGRAQALAAERALARA